MVPSTIPVPKLILKALRLPCDPSQVRLASRHGAHGRYRGRAQPITIRVAGGGGRRRRDCQLPLSQGDRPTGASFVDVHARWPREKKI